MGERFFAEHQPSQNEAWVIYDLRTLASEDSTYIFTCSRRDDAETLVKALDRITAPPLKAAEPYSQPPQT